MKKVKNNTEETKTWVGQEILSGEYYEIQQMEQTKWANDSTFLAALAVAEAIINDGTSDIEDLNTAIDYLKDNTPKKFIQTLGTDDFSMQPVGFYFSPEKETASDHDLVLPEAYAIKGGVMYVKNPKLGDHVKVQIVDKDNVLGYGPGVVLSTYVEKWMVFPEPALNEVIDVSIGILPVPGLYLRVIYTSLAGATVNPECVLNLYTYLVG